MRSLNMDDKAKKINAAIETEISEGRLGGAQVYLSMAGNTIIDRSYGTVRDNTIFRIYSMSKLITMVAVMILVQQKKISVTDKVSKFYPSFKERKIFDENGKLVDAKEEMTVQHLLNMTSGLGYPVSDVSMCDDAWSEFEKEMAVRLEKDKKISMQDFCNAMGRIPGAFEAGTKWKYGASADLLGGIVEKVSGLPFDRFLKREIFIPLGMSDTDFYVPQDKLDRLAAMYTRDPFTGKIHILETKVQAESDRNKFTLPDTSVIRTQKPFFLSGGAGIYCTCKDYLKILEMLLQGGKYGDVRILDEETVSFICAPQLEENVRNSIYQDTVAGSVLQGYSYSNLVRILLNPSETADYGRCGAVGEYGWDGLPGNYYMIDPENQIILIFMMQVREGPEVPFRAKLRKLIYNGQKLGG